MDDDVALVQWPAGESQRVDLARRQVPRLLLVDTEADPPLCTDVLEDWARLPASEDDVRARTAALAVAARNLAQPVPSVAEHGVFRYRSEQIVLSPQQTRLVRPLVDRFGAVVSRQTLVVSAWPDNDNGDAALDVPVMRLRRRLAAVGLEIRTVRSRGYLLERSTA